MFPKIVVSAFTGLVLYLCHDFSCLFTGSRFWFCFKSSSVILSVGGEKFCQFLVLIGELCQVGHGVQKLDLLCILNHLFVVLIKSFYRSNFLFQLMEKVLFYASVVLFSFVEYYFLSIVSKELV